MNKLSKGQKIAIYAIAIPVLFFVFISLYININSLSESNQELKAAEARSNEILENIDTAENVAKDPYAKIVIDEKLIYYFEELLTLQHKEWTNSEIEKRENLLYCYDEYIRHLVSEINKYEAYTNNYRYRMFKKELQDTRYQINMYDYTNAFIDWNKRLEEINVMNRDEFRE